MHRDELSEGDLVALAPTEKIAIVATIDGAGRPHMSLLSSLMGVGRRTLAIGEFTRGLSKDFMRIRPSVGFLAMTLDRKLWRGSARWKGSAREGPEYEAFNKKPMFRYNSYFGVNTVHYLELREIEGPSHLPLVSIAAATIATAIRGSARSLRSETPALPPFARGIVDALASLSFLSWIDREAVPRIAPILQARTAGPGRIVFAPGPYGGEIAGIPEGAAAAVFSANLSMESVLCKGTLSGASRPPAEPRLAPGLAPGLAVLDIEEVYDSMPPAHGLVYPRAELAPVRDFAWK